MRGGRLLLRNGRWRRQRKPLRLKVGGWPLGRKLTLKGAFARVTRVARVPLTLLLRWVLPLKWALLLVLHGLVLLWWRLGRSLMGIVAHMRWAPICA